MPVERVETVGSDCGIIYDEEICGVYPGAIYAPNSVYASALGNFPYAVCWGDETETFTVPCNINLSFSPYYYTNGHYHSVPPPPSSGIAPTSGYTGQFSNKAMPLTLTTTPVGQFENITVTCNSGIVGSTCYGSGFDYAVGYPNLVFIDNSNIFVQIGVNSTTNHGDNTFNHWMTVNAATGLQQAATAYINSNNPGHKVCINDMALLIGGKFDICNSAANLCTNNGSPVINPWGEPPYLARSGNRCRCCGDIDAV